MTSLRSWFETRHPLSVTFWDLWFIKFNGARWCKAYFHLFIQLILLGRSGWHSVVRFLDIAGLREPIRTSNNKCRRTETDWSQAGWSCRHLRGSILVSSSWCHQTVFWEAIVYEVMLCLGSKNNILSQCDVQLVVLSKKWYFEWNNIFMII